MKLFVGLKIPDTTAITTFHTIERMGYSIKGVKREMYYEFDSDFSDKVGNVDVLVNANKNKFSLELEKEEGAVYILVKDTDDTCSGLMKTLHKLGFDIKKMEKGVLWALFVDSEEIAKEIASKLLFNENYQEIEIL
jgi:phosphoribosylformylglycinamidine (FGAM) synthase PurS component